MRNDITVMRRGNSSFIFGAGNFSETSLKSFVCETMRNDLYSDEDDAASCSCPLTGELASLTDVCSMV